MKKQISVIGCGWLGFPLAKKLIQQGYTIKGSTTSKNKLEILKNASIESHIVMLNEDGISGDYTAFLAKSETVIINIPPGLRKNPSKNHVTELEYLVSAVEGQRIKNVLYISSTSVFKDEVHFPIIEENTIPNATSNSAKQLIAIEQMLQDNVNFNTTILRFGGLFDKDRHPAKFISGRNNVSNPNAPINLIHKDDCISIILTLIKQDIWNISLNAVCPKHLDKKSYYSDYCKRYNLPLPSFYFSEKSKGKRIDSSKLVHLLNYSFKQAP
ncbi:SDR family NAD(P)-dependent oxidoreductase [uncultured Winogradskyella sp.]|uniref:SDR family NAD(P)-dependent oxidoreductase n=1 Tax=uncultured Winogradskyella sp. TaxID=395353 RepID=UPI00260AD6D1|nr:SDR family NAD(P)-dependent oxidoreductase [uncultured Winogradskyella sp.]